MKMKTFSAALIAIAISYPAYSDVEEAEKSSSDEEYSEMKRGHEHHAGKRHMRSKMAQHMMRKVDTNDDGQVDLNEFLSNAEQRFTSMDSNADGLVTKEEMREAHKAMNKEHRQAMKKERKVRREVREKREEREELEEREES